MKNIKLILEYDGTNYKGYQKQDKFKTIQGTLENILSEICKENIEIIGCSRTDSGVHAKGYVANFVANSSIPPEKFSFALNQRLPKDIVILSSEEAPMEFHSRFSCSGKTYCYTIINRQFRSAIHRNNAYHVSKPLDVNKMIEASKLLIGKKDFSAFRNVGTEVASTVRTITSIDIKKNDDFIKIYVTGDGFLYNMVRIIVGTFVEIGLNVKDNSVIELAFKNNDRAVLGKTAPAQGLSLEEVFY
ncbi:MAG: tRNA pseudouridine(38-40) synthase TruA [Clostridiaceae bacterium]